MSANGDSCQLFALAINLILEGKMLPAVIKSRFSTNVYLIMIENVVHCSKLVVCCYFMTEDDN